MPVNYRCSFILILLLQAVACQSMAGDSEADSPEGVAALFADDLSCQGDERSFTCHFRNGEIQAYFRRDASETLYMSYYESGMVAAHMHLKRGVEVYEGYFESGEIRNVYIGDRRNDWQRFTLFSAGGEVLESGEGACSGPPDPSIPPGYEESNCNMLLDL